MEERSLLDYFRDGGFFMWPILLCFVAGLGISIERMISLMRAGVNTKQFVDKIKQAIDEGGVERATEVCANQRGALASVFHAGLLRAGKGVEHVEKAIINAGAIEMAFLERGMVWLAFFIAVAPMLGFTGTVQGMIIAFDNIAAANDIAPNIVANGIRLALYTTLFGLIVAIMLQFFYNFFTARINRIVADMEESSSELVDHILEREGR